MRNSMDAFAALLKRYRGRILYYAGVAVVLTAIALAAESYRSGEAGELIVPEAELAPVLMQAEPEASIICPEGMELLRGFSVIPEWNRELQQWESHGAVDYILTDGRAECLEGGIVQTVGKSGVYGGFVELDCGGRLYRYASVEPAESLEPGMEIEAGELIGAADGSMPGESLHGAHLHLEVYENGAAVDFEALLHKIEG